jgi:GAF domain-containing protein
MTSVDADEGGFPVKAVPQQWMTRQVLAEAGVDPFEVWVVYVGLGGTGEGLLVDGYLSGLLRAPRTDRDLIARAVNVLVEERPDAGGHAPLRGDPAWQGAEAFGSYPDSDVVPADLIRPLVSASAAEDLRLESLDRAGLLQGASRRQLDAVTAEAARRFPGCASSLALATRRHHVVTSAAGSIGPADAQAFFCHRTIDGPGPFIVTDALHDPRVSSDPVVVGEPHLRFYAGYPVLGPGGWRIGSLCVAADQPRGFSLADARSLRILAASVQGLIGV